MNISLVDVDKGNFPNLALMKISAFHKNKGDLVKWYDPLFDNPDLIYASKIFTFSKDFTDYMPKHEDIVVRGGTGYNFNSLPDEIETQQPDYELYGVKNTSYGFLSRGCIRNCPWCVVPEKEGGLKEITTMEHISNGNKKVILMDNNFLACSERFIETNLKFAIDNKLTLDFNQGLDARLVTDEVAKLLAKVRWAKYIRFSCDTDETLDDVKEAIYKLHNNWFKYGYFVYFLCKDAEKTAKRVSSLDFFISVELEDDHKFYPFVQPYRDLGNKIAITHEQKRLARWANNRIIFNSCSFEDYKD